MTMIGQPERASSGGCDLMGEVFVFVDECQRTQSGKLHRTMKALLHRNDNPAVFIGFTGTPLLKQDRQTSLEVFDGYIHTYKFSKAVEDEVVLDLIYEARDIDQKLGASSKIDAWFNAKSEVVTKQRGIHANQLHSDRP